MGKLIVRSAPKACGKCDGTGQVCGICSNAYYRCRRHIRPVTCPLCDGQGIPPDEMKRMEDFYAEKEAKK